MPITIMPIIHPSYVPILVDRLQLHYRYDKAKGDECDHWRDWSKAVFTQHLKIIWRQTEDVADRTFLEAVRDLPFQYDLENIEVEQKTLTADRTEGDDFNAVKILMEKLYDVEHINWTARFHKILRKLNMTFPVENICEFRFVLINMFEAVRQDINEMQTVLHYTLSGNSRTRTSEPTKREKAPSGQPPTGAPAKLCTVCGRYFHEATTCRLKESKYANHANKPYVGSEAHARLVKDKGIQATFIPLEGSGNNPNLKRKAESAPSERPNTQIKKD